MQDNYAQQFEAVLTAKGGIMSGNMYYGAYQGFPYTAQYQKGSERGYNFVLSFMVAQNVNTKVIKEIGKNFASRITEKAKVKNLNSTGNLLRMSVATRNASEFSAQIDQLLQAAAEQMHSAGYSPSQMCAICKQPGIDSYAFVGAGYTTVHKNCVVEDVNTKVSKAQDNEQNGNYFLGFLGAVLGGIVGCLPSVLLVLFFNVISAWVCALVPLAAYFGYKLCKGKMNAFAPIITVLVSIIMIPVMDYFITLIDVYQQSIEYYGMGYFMSLSEYIQWFAEAPGEFLPAIGQVALFVGLGVVVVFGIIRQGNKQVYMEAQSVSATLQPIPGTVPAAGIPAEYQAVPAGSPQAY